MTPDFVASLVNLGSAGAVIIVVIIFLRSNEKRDVEWRVFFTSLNTDNKTDICKLADLMDRMIDTLKAHDVQAKEIKSSVDVISRTLSHRKPTKVNQFIDRTDRS
jgi:hypothetical protein